MARLLFVVLALAVALPATGASAASPPLVSYSRTGGFIGVRDSLSVFRDGSVTSTNGDFRLSDRRLQALRNLLRAARFATLQRRYEAEAPVSDGYVFRVTYAGRTVTVEEDAQPPLRLRRVLSVLGGMLSRLR
jgi:hypothetical protein